MRKEITELVKHSGIYGLGSILSKSVGFLMIPVYTHYLAPADYGVLEMLDLIVFFSGLFAMMGISSAFFRFYVASESEEEKADVTSTALFAVGGISLVVLALMQLMPDLLSTIAFGNPSSARLVRIVACTLFFSTLMEVPLASLRAQQRTVLYVLIGLARTVLNATLLVIALVLLHKGVLGVLYANLISNALVGVVLVSALVRRVRGRVSRGKFEPMFRYGAPLIVPSLASFVLVFSDRLFLRHFTSLSEVGIYGLAYKLAGAVPLLVTGPFNMTWAWQQFEFAKHEKREIYARVQTYQIIVSVFVALGVSVMAKDVLRILTPSSYWGAADIVPIIACCYVLEGIRAVVNSGILIRKVTHHLALIGVVVAVVDLMLNYLLIPRFHAMGAAIATLVAYAVSLAMSYLAAQRVFHIRFEYRRSAVILGSATTIYMASRFIDLPLAASVGSCAVLMFVFAAVCFGILDREERGLLLTRAHGTWHELAVFLARYQRRPAE